MTAKRLTPRIRVTLRLEPEMAERINALRTLSSQNEMIRYLLVLGLEAFHR